MMPCILIMAGGTGGHVFPGLAVANELKQRGWDIQWLGTAQRMEAQLVPKSGYPISFIDVAGVRGNGLVRLLKAPFQIVKSICQARKVIRQCQPDVVLGMGGFASGPGGIAAWLSGKPLVVHEQNAAAGMTNRILANLAKKVLCGFEGTFASRLANKAQWVGNPVREEIEQITEVNKPHSPLRVLVIGGSLGAKVLNETVPGAIAGLENIDVWHQCGKDNANAVSAAYQSRVGNINTWRADDFIDDMAGAYAWADVVICRAGALTVAELAVTGKPAIYVPLPHAVDDHQTLNARSLTDLGAGVLLPQSELSETSLTSKLKNLQQDPDTLKNMSQLARKRGKRGVAQTIASLCQQLAGEPVGGAA